MKFKSRSHVLNNFTKQICKFNLICNRYKVISFVVSIITITIEQIYDIYAICNFIKYRASTSKKFNYNFNLTYDITKHGD